MLKTWEEAIVKSGEGAMCLICGKVFTTFWTGKTHYEEVHRADTSAVFPCHICGKPFGVERYRKCHLNKIHGIKKRLGGTGTPGVIE